jgi:hypothetical protein
MFDAKSLPSLPVKTPSKFLRFAILSVCSVALVVALPVWCLWAFIWIAQF